LSERDAGLSSRPSVAELDFLSSSLSDRAVSERDAGCSSRRNGLLSSTSRRRRSVACPAALPALVRVSRQQLCDESLDDCGECGEKAPSAALSSIPSESATLGSSPRGGTSRCPSSTSCRLQVAIRAVVRVRLLVVSKWRYEPLSELDFLSSLLSDRAVGRLSLRSTSCFGCLVSDRGVIHLSLSSTLSSSLSDRSVSLV
jgi:hypothetical protein